MSNQTMNREVEKRVKISVTDGVELDGLLCLGKEAQTSPVIVCHPHPAYGGSMHNNVVAAVVGEFIGRAVTTLRFNYRSTGGSQATEGCRGEVQDLLVAVGYLEAQLGRSPAPVLVVGYSFGAYVALEAAAQCVNVKAVCCIAPPVSSMAMEGVGRFEKAKYFIHGLRDGYGPPEDFEAWYKELPQPKEASMLDTDHFYIGVESLVATQVADKLLG